jgi:protein-S-isoprenylcysteine O-methyltransferase Ste14
MVNGASPRLPGPVRLLLRIPVPWVFVLGYLAGVVVEAASGVPARGLQLSHVRLVGAVVFAIGAVLAAWGLLTFRKARTTTVPGERSSQLVMRGPYRFTRNPMYVGLTLAYIGEAGILAQVWPLVLLPLVIAYVHWVVIPLEESTLADAFGPAYEQYRARVRRWL